MSSHEILSNLYIIKENKFQNNLLNTIGVDFVTIYSSLESQNYGLRRLKSEISISKK